MMVELTRVTRDAEIRYMPSGEPVANVSLAYSYGTKKDDRGFLPSQFIECGLWGKRAESLAPLLTKGKRILAYVTDVHIETFTKNDGSPGYKLAGRLSDLKFADSQQQGDGQESGQRDPQRQPMRQASAQPSRHQAQQPSGSGFEDMDDDIPF